jgi:hypothetical protein
MRGRAILFALVFVGTSVASGGPAHADVEPTYQVKTAAYLRADLEEAIPRLHAWLDVTSFRDAGLTELALRPALGVRISDWGIVWAGYAYAPLFPAQATRVDEHRFFQMLTGRWMSPRLELDFWGRLEERFRPSSGDIGFRFRALGRLRVHLGQSGFLFVASNELFLELNETSYAAAGLDQNRLFAGFGLQATSSLRFEAGYGLRYAPVPGPNTLAHQLGVELYVDLGL